MVPMLTCGLVRSNFAFATWGPPVDYLIWYVGCGLSAGLFARGLRDDLFRHGLRDRGVGLELHGVARPALGLRPQVADVAEHLRQRHRGADDAGAAALLHRLDVTAAGVEVADDVAHVLLGRDDLDRHHRLEDHRVGPAGS